MGLERSGGFKAVAFCEIDKYCKKVLAKHWPEVPIYSDVKTLTARQLRADGITVDAICGGFPCQDISVAGTGRGLKGERSGLWTEFARIISELGPRYVIVENVSALLSRGLGRVLGDLASIGYDAEWHCIPASYIGAPHRRDRVWIVAYSNHGQRKQQDDSICSRGNAVNTCSEEMADSDCPMLERQRIASRIQKERNSFSGTSWWSTEPNVGRVAHGIPLRVDRLKALGNAVVPQIPEIIGRSICHLT